MNIFYRAIRFIFYVPLRIIFPFKIIGLENCPKKGGLIVCANHTTMIDPIYLIVAFRREIHFMAKDELFKIPILGWFFKRMNAFAIKRGQGDKEALEYGINLVKNGKVMGIFPEGTRSKTGEPGRAKAGIAVISYKTGANLLPVAIIAKGKKRLFRPVTIRVGETIENAGLKMTDETPAMFKRVSQTIMEKITDLWKTGK